MSRAVSADLIVPRIAHRLPQRFVSWKNPGPEMRDVGFDDYVTDGVDAAVRAAREISGTEKVHAVGYCIGGTLLAVYMAWLSRRMKRECIPVAHWTLLASLVDFQSPGDIEVFIDEGSVAWLANNMRQRGYLDGAEMAATFRLLRANPLLWHFVVHSWLYRERPQASDVLYWNMDTTRMPYRMHEYCLRELYRNNRLVKPGALVIAGEPIELPRIHTPLYVVAAEDDHITPWRQVFKINSYVTGPKRYVLSSSGHIPEHGQPARESAEAALPCRCGVPRRVAGRVERLGRAARGQLVDGLDRLARRALRIAWRSSTVRDYCLSKARQSPRNQCCRTLTEREIDEISCSQDREAEKLQQVSIGDEQLRRTRGLDAALAWRKALFAPFE
jgi:pimeloyl-ACP methyl ester carboxylesterase